MKRAGQEEGLKHSISFHACSSFSQARKNNDAEMEALREEFQHRLGAAERKVYALTKERDMLRREQGKKGDTSTLLREKDEIIKQVMKEGEELSKKQAVQEAAMKKLRAQVRELEEDKARLSSKLQVRWHLNNYNFPGIAACMIKNGRDPDGSWRRRRRVSHRCGGFLHCHDSPGIAACIMAKGRDQHGRWRRKWHGWRSRCWLHGFSPIGTPNKSVLVR